MALNLRGQSFLALLDFSSQQIRYLLDLSHNFKNLKRTGTAHDTLRGKNVAIIFEKTSTRTRCAFEVAAYDLGMGLTYLDPSGSQIGKKESIEDTAKVLGRFYDGIEFRGKSQDAVNMLAEHSGVPVWNGLTDEFHPTQILADFLTVEEHVGHLKGVKFAFVGDAKNNMGNSLMIGSAKMGLDFRAVAPKSCWPQEELVAKAKEIAAHTGAKITLTEDVAEGVKDAQVVYSDVWVSMGEPESVWEERIKLLKPYQVTSAMMKHAASDAIFMHCLPAFHDTETTIGKDIAKRFNIHSMEVTDEVFRSKQSVVFDQAENRMHTIKAVMYATLS